MPPAWILWNYGDNYVHACRSIIYLLRIFIHYVQIQFFWRQFHVLASLLCILSLSVIEVTKDFLLQYFYFRTIIMFLSYSKFYEIIVCRTLEICWQMQLAIVFVTYGIAWIWWVTRSSKCTLEFNHKFGLISFVFHQHTKFPFIKVRFKAISVRLT